jgi:alanine dehydrogenase
MPGAVPKTSTISLNTATLPYIESIANNGLSKFLNKSEHHLHGLNTFKGHLTYKPVAELFDIPFSDPRDLI